VPLTLELVRRFEQHLAGAVESLLTHSLQVSGNPEGYALFREGPILATLSTNPRAGWATQQADVRGGLGLRHAGFHTILWREDIAYLESADFENESRTNQTVCGLSVAYTAAVWAQRPDAMLSPACSAG
jgi:hypothetical protein